jgi:hypothetical protein
MVLKNHKSVSEELSLENGLNTPDFSYPAYSRAGPTILKTYSEASDHNLYTYGWISQVPDDRGNLNHIFTEPLRRGFSNISRQGLRKTVIKDRQIARSFRYRDNIKGPYY